MSFASEVREELCREVPDRHCCRTAECYGILLFCSSFSRDGIRIVTENRSFAELLPRLFYKTFHLDFDQFPSLEQPGKLTFVIDDPDKVDFLLTAYGHDHESVALDVNFGNLEEDCCRRSFLRGAFLAGGSVTDPDKRYHLEIITPRYHLCSEVTTLMRELGFDPKVSTRGGNNIIYFKQSDAIVDFLTVIGSAACAMKIIEAKLEKGFRNNINRRVNCETANLSKTVDASLEQVAAIRQLRKSGAFDDLPKKLRDAALLREENPEATLAELAEMIDPPISKPAMSHRLRRLIELSQEA